jgi:hypothetical protein
VREHSTVRRQPDPQKPGSQSVAFNNADLHDDDLFADGDERRRERLLSIGMVKPEPGDKSPPQFVRGKQASQKQVRIRSAELEPDAALRRPTPAWAFVLLGFLVGIGFWHVVGFWGFINQIVLPPQKPAQAASSSEPTGITAQANAPSYQPARPTRSRP